MHNYTFNYDKKIKTYMLIFMIAGLLSTLIPFMMIADNSYFGDQYSYISAIEMFGGSYYVLLGFSVISALFLYYIYYMDVSFSCVIQSDYLKFGTLGLKKIYYKDIDSLSFDRHILLHCGEKKYKIRVLNFEENEDKYCELLNEIKENCNLDFSVDDAMKQLSYINNFEFAEEGKALRLNGWLFVAYVFFIIYTVLMGLYLFPTILISLLSFSWRTALMFIILALFFALLLITTIFMGKRHKKTPAILKGIIIGAAVLVSISVIISLFSGVLITIDFPLSSYILMIISYACFMLIIIRALKISKRVKYTFVYGKMQPMQNYDRSIDPGYKLFAWEPASIYGVFGWIIAPILVVIITIYIVIATLTSSMMY